MVENKIMLDFYNFFNKYYTESGYNNPLLSKTTLARYSKLTWCTIPDPGGTIYKF